MGSREIYLAVLDGTETPDLISPASSLQISLLQQQSAAKFGQSVVNPADEVNCRPMLETPLVLVAWRERADALWNGDPGDNSDPGIVKLTSGPSHSVSSSRNDNPKSGFNLQTPSISH